MATQKPISTISYNTVPFLKEKLDLWLSEHIIQSYMFIHHKGEDGDKDHTHLRIEPNKKLDPMDLSDKLLEYEHGKKKPLGCRPWRPSSEEDWLLYAVHDKDYLRIKYGGGEKGEKLPYKWEDIVAPENYDVEVAFIRARSKLEHTSANLATLIKEGGKPLDLVLNGENVYTVNAIMRALQTNDYQRLQSEYFLATERLQKLCAAIQSWGFDIVEDDNGISIVKSSDSAARAAAKRADGTHDDEMG